MVRKGLDCLCNFASEMRKHLLFILLILCFVSMANAFQPHHRGQLSPQAKVSMLTASPGPELYTVFGHSALWVHDPANGIDEVYNWGTFDFNTPNFYPLFIQGRLLYMLTVTSLNSFLYSYMIDGRSVHEQVLNLTAAEKQDIYDFLQINRQPENIHYYYDFFFDNCATRVRDLVDMHLDIDWGPDPHPYEERSFRQMLKPYVQHIPWISFGIDLLLGLPSDKIATPWHYMFLPDEMAIAFQQARHGDGRMLVSGYNELLPLTFETARSFPVTPTMVFWALWALGVLSLLKPRAARIFDKVYFTVLGLAGLMLFYLWFVSDHHATAQNLSLLWALPTHLYFIYRASVLSANNKTYGPGGSLVKRLPVIYFRMVFVAGVLLLILWPLNPQGFHPAFFPIIALMTLMASKYAWRWFWVPKA